MIWILALIGVAGVLTIIGVWIYLTVVAATRRDT